MTAVTSTARTSRKLGTALAVLAILFALLFQYRILSLLKRLGIDVAPVGGKLPLPLDFQSAPPWLLPIYYTLDYLNTVWFTTLLGLLITGAAVAFMPGFLRRQLSQGGWQGHLAAVALGLPNMLCTCCAATTLPGLRKAGAGLGPALAFFVTAPSLNVVVILLAFQMLPFRLAVARVVLGITAAAGVTYLLGRVFPGAIVYADPSRGELVEESASGLIGSWLWHTWEAARSAVPVLVLGILAISVLKTFVPFETVAGSLRSGAVSTLAAALLGTILMVPTFTEVLWVQEFTRQGMGVAPAVALLVTLPAVSLPSLWVLGRVFGSYRLAASLGAAIALLGFAGGIVFSLI